MKLANFYLYIIAMILTMILAVIVENEYTRKKTVKHQTAESPIIPHPSELAFTANNDPYLTIRTPNEHGELDIEIYGKKTEAARKFIEYVKSQMKDYKCEKVK